MSAASRRSTIRRLVRVGACLSVAFAASVSLLRGGAPGEAPRFAAPEAPPPDTARSSGFGAGQIEAPAPSFRAGDLPPTATTPAGQPPVSPSGADAGQLPDPRFPATQPAGDAAPSLPGGGAIPPGVSEEEGYRSLFRDIDDPRPPAGADVEAPPAAGAGTLPPVGPGGLPDSGTVPPDEAITPPAETVDPAGEEPGSFGLPPATTGNLLVQLRDTLRAREAEMHRQYVAGQARLTDLLAATDEVFRAELGLKATTDQRQQLCQKYIDNLTEFETKLDTVVSSGSSRYTRADYLAVKATRLRAEILLSQEQDAPALKGGDRSFYGRREEAR